MKHIIYLTLLLNFGVAAMFADERPVRMSFSGNGAPSAANLGEPNTNTAEENVAGTGMLGGFTLRNITAQSTLPQPSESCSGANQIFLPRVAGGGIFRFRDGSLLKVKLLEGGDCIDLAAQEARCTLTLQIAGGTGRFKSATGTLRYSETAVLLLKDTSNNPVLTTEVGRITGTISGVSGRDEWPDQEQSQDQDQLQDRQQ